MNNKKMVYVFDDAETKEEGAEETPEAPAADETSMGAPAPMGAADGDSEEGDEEKEEAA